MEPGLIQRKEGESYAAAGPGASIGLFMVLGVVIFCFSIAATLGLVFYKKLINGQITEMAEELKKHEEDFSSSNIDEWARTAESIQIAKDALAKHRRLTSVFTYLEQNTLPDVRFSKFAYSSEENSITLIVHARNYTALAHQKEIFEAYADTGRMSIDSYILTPVGGVDATMKVYFIGSIFGAQ